MKCERYRIEIEEAEQRQPSTPPPDSARLSADARAHLGACARCREFYLEQTTIVRLVGALSRVVAPNDFEFRLRARLAAAEDANTRNVMWRGFVPGAVSIALATVFVFVITLTLQLRRRPDDRRPMAHAVEAQVNRAGTEASTIGDVKSIEVPPAVAEVRSGHGRERADRAAASGQRRGALTVTRELSLGAKFGKSNVESAVFSLRSAPAVGTPHLPPSDETMSASDSPIAVTLPASVQPLKVVLSDATGAARVVSMKSVSFGAQQLVGQVKEGTRAAALGSKEVVW